MGSGAVANLETTVTATAGQSRAVRTAALLVVLHQAAEVAVPLVIGLALERAVETSDGGALTRWLLLLAGLFVALSAAGCTGLYLHDRTVARSAHGLRRALGRRVVDPAGGLGDLSAGDLVSRSTVEATRSAEAIGGRIVAAGALAGTLVAAGVLLTISWSLGLVVLLGLPVLLLVVQLLTTPLVERADEQQEAAAAASTSAVDLLSGLRVLKGLRAEHAASERYRRASREALDAALGATTARARYAGAALTVGGLFLGVVAWMGGRQALDGTITIGELVAALGVTQFLIGPLGRLAYVGGLFAQGSASNERIDEVLAAPPAVTAGTEDGPAAGAASLKVGQLRSGTLRGLDLEVAAGELLGIVALDPADALALVACLGREVDPDDGTIALGGHDLAGLALDDARTRVLVADHDAVLLDRELATNLAGADDAVRAAARVDDVTGPDVGEGGTSLSGGQRQRVALARALAADADVLVLHEPTTAVDAATEAAIAAGLREVRAKRTTVVITSSPALLSIADRVVVIADGAVVDEGTHKALAKRSDPYRSAVLS